MKVRKGQPLPAVLGPLYDDLAGQLPAAVEELARYRQAAIEPVWQRVRGLAPPTWPSHIPARHRARKPSQVGRSNHLRMRDGM